MRNLNLIIVFLMSFLLVSCPDRSTNNSNNSNNSNNTNNSNDDTIQQVQDPNNASFIAKGDNVDLEDVIVTAVDKYGDHTGNFWVSEPNGGPYSGVVVFNYDTSADWWQSIKVGDLVRVSGKKDEYSYADPQTGEELFDDPLTEITEATVTIKGSGTEVTPTDIQASDLLTLENGEQWEGVLVKLTNVRVTTAGDNSGRFEVNLYQGTKAQDDLVDISTIQDGACLSHLTGVVTYFFDFYIMPRSASDIEVSADDNACPTVANEICDDNIDNDGNGFTDCDDFACIGDAACPAKIENTDALCGNSIDDDGDGLTDCQDPSCAGHPDVTICVETSCDDTVDNDGDGYTDCEDFDCSNDAACAGSFEQNCGDGLDDDGDGHIDCEDFDCSDDASCMETNCTDGIDNNGDTYIDCADFDCLYTEPTCQTGNEITDAECSDGIDNDGDTHIDCSDFSCQQSPLTTICEGNARTCSDGVDNDGNGFVDCSDFACRYCSADGQSDKVVSTCPPCDHTK